jgi:hypothetical protein
MVLSSYIDASNYTSLYINATSLIFTRVVAGVSAVSALAGTFVPGSTYKVAASWGGAGSYCSVSGVSGATNASAVAAPLSATATISLLNNGGQSGGASKNLQLFTTQLTQAQLNALTA